MRTLFLLFISVNSFGQITFEKGYFIDNNDKKTECLIKNIDSKDNPSKIVYKLIGSDSIKRGNAESMKEFSVYGYSRFIRADVKIDTSKVTLDELTYDKNPNWSQEKLFLKIIVDAKASLYSYENGRRLGFFYSVAGSPIQQLVYKQYLVEGTSDIPRTSTNNYFRQQLWRDVRSETTTMKTIEKIRYNFKDLEQYFKDFNHYENNPVVTSEVRIKRNVFNIKVAPGFNYSSLIVQNTTGLLTSPPGNTLSFDNTFNFRLGLELEYVLPFNKNKWAILLEPTYQTLNANGSSTAINYATLEFPIALRHYFYLTSNSKIFLNCFYVLPFNYDLNNPVIEITTSSTTLSLAIKNGSSFAIGAGVEFGKLSVEARYYGARDLLNDEVVLSTDYRRSTLIFGYKIFKGYTKW